MKKIIYLSTASIILLGVWLFVYTQYPSDASETSISSIQLIDEKNSGSVEISIYSNNQTRKMILDELAVKAGIIIDYSGLTKEQLNEPIHLANTKGSLETLLSTILS